MLGSSFMNSYFSRVFESFIWGEFCCVDVKMEEVESVMDEEDEDMCFCGWSEEDDDGVFGWMEE